MICIARNMKTYAVLILKLDWSCMGILTAKSSMISEDPGWLTQVLPEQPVLEAVLPVWFSLLVKLYGNWTVTASKRVMSHSRPLQQLKY
jgi:hypothetical protein